MNGNLVGVGPGNFPFPGNNGGPTQTSPISRTAGARNSGDNGVCPPTDQRGAARNDGFCDIGATEFSSLQTIVDTTQDNPGGVVDSNVAGCSLREAIQAIENANSFGDCSISVGFDDVAEILFDSSLSQQTIALDGQAISVYGISVYIDAKSVSGITVDASQFSRVMNVDNGAYLTLDSMTITGGSESSSGGGIRVANSSLTLNDSQTTNNTARSGGGISLTGARLFARNTSISSNSVTYRGGGIYADNESSVYLRGSSVTRNVADESGVGGPVGRAGGISLRQSTLNATDATISSNSTTFGGGGIRASDSAVYLTNSTVSKNVTDNLSGGGVYLINGSFSSDSSTFSNNTAPRGGAIFSRFLSGTSAPIVTLTNSTVSGNKATPSASSNQSYASAILAYDNSVLSLINSTIANNSEDQDGFARGAVKSTGVFVLRNSVIADTGFGADCAVTGVFDTDANSIVEDASCSVSSLDAMVSARAGDPGLDSLSNNGGRTQTHALRVNSIARGTGNADTCTSVDQRGKSRFEDDAVCDVGSVEFDAGDGAGFIVIPLAGGRAVVIPN